ncbi:MAG: hypothetical protein EOM12_12835 [Verrucomicrobiae bacterium]|nr:hypothetical protein [Verrucomicrobiae bacterium]
MDEENATRFSIVEPLGTTMRCGILSNEQGEILIIHDQKIAVTVQWVEFNKNNNKLYLIHDDGTSQDLGIALDSQMKKNLARGVEVTFALLQDKTIVSRHKVSLVVQDY